MERFIPIFATSFLECSNLPLSFSKSSPVWYLIRLTSDPIPWEIQHFTKSPSFNHTFGDLELPIPEGVPVMMMVPAGRVFPCDKNEMILCPSQLCPTQPCRAITQTLGQARRVIDWWKTRM